MPELVSHFDGYDDAFGFLNSLFEFFPDCILQHQGKMQVQGTRKVSYNLLFVLNVFIVDACLTCHLEI